MKTTETYKGINIEIENDTHAENPWENWDGCVPMITDGGRQFISRKDDDIVNYLRNYLTYNQVRRHQKRIIEMMQGDTSSPYTYSFKEFKEDYPLKEFDRTEMLKDDLLYNWLDEGIENLETFCVEFNIKHLSSASKGYSQGDHIDCFFCWTPEFEKITGRDYKSITDEDFNNALDLFSAYAWGDVYGYNVEENGDSCWGFYGDDHEKSGLLEEARSNIDCYLEAKKKERENKLKTLISNKVPLTKREELLAV